MSKNLRIANAIAFLLFAFGAMQIAGESPAARKAWVEERSGPLPPFEKVTDCIMAAALVVLAVANLKAGE